MSSATLSQWLLQPPVWTALAAWVAGVSLLGLERRGRGVVALLVLAALAALVGLGGEPYRAPLVIGLVVAALARDPRESLHAECAIKLLWVMGAALALSLAGLQLLTLATGTSVVAEQWAVLGLGLDPRFLWSTALPLSLLVGLVLLGGAPFHFWIADAFQGVRPWLAPLGVAALQLAGAAWLIARLEGVSSFRPAALLAGSLLWSAAFVSFVAGAVTLIVQRRPERRAGTLASLNGALFLAAIATGRPLDAPAIVAWGAHLTLALTGASTLSRFLPASSAGGESVALGAPLFRRHPGAALAGLFALFSLAGVPGTPGAALWFDTARALAETRRVALLVVVAGAWIAAFTVAVRQMREAVGVPAPAGGPPVQPVPVAARAALWIAGLGLLALELEPWIRRWLDARVS